MLQLHSAHAHIACNNDSGTEGRVEGNVQMTRVTTRRARASVAMKLACAPGTSLLAQWRTASSVRMRKKRSVRSSICAPQNDDFNQARLNNLQDTTFTEGRRYLNREA